MNDQEWGLAIIVAVVVAMLHFTRPSVPNTLTANQLLAPSSPTERFAPSPTVLGAQQYGYPTATNPPSVVPTSQILADEAAGGAQTVDIGGFTYQTLPSTYSM